jgi:hypothetical protein
LWRLRENVRRRRPKLWRENTWLLHHDNDQSRTSVVTQQVSGEKQNGCHPPPTVLLLFGTPLFLPFSKMKLKLKGPRFDTIEEIQAESQRVLHTLTENDFQETFQKWRR